MLAGQHCPASCAPLAGCARAGLPQMRGIAHAVIKAMT
jgi:hypothetical protein